MNKSITENSSFILFTGRHWTKSVVVKNCVCVNSYLYHNTLNIYILAKQAPNRACARFGWRCVFDSKFIQHPIDCNKKEEKKREVKILTCLLITGNVSG